MRCVDSGRSTWEGAVVAEKITLAGASETLLGTLYARGLDAISPHPILGDRAALEVARKLEYDFHRLGVRRTDAIGIVMRAKVLDGWVRDFLAVNPVATVLHLGCGLDSRVQRLDPAPGVRWVDLDQPPVIALRERLYDPRPGYSMIAASVTDAGWLAEVPTDRPAIVVAEGLTMYLPAEQGPPLLRRLVDHLPRGEFAFDTYSRLAVRLSRLLPILRRTGARLDWGVDDPRALVRDVPGLRLITTIGAFEAADAEDLAHAPPGFRRQLAVIGRVPGLRDLGRISRFAFGDQPGI